MGTKFKIAIGMAVAAMVVTAILIAAITLSSYKGAETEAQQNVPITRTFFFAAEEIQWDYAPVETDLLKEKQRYADPSLAKSEEPLRLGSSYKKAVFREYTDGTYTEKKSRPTWLGMLGPLVETEVGDKVEIHLFNKAIHPVSLHAHGAHYEKHHEGAVYEDNTVEKRDDKVHPGGNYTYIWTIRENRSPTESDTPCMLWAYHSHVSGDEDIHTGLIGPLLICRKGALEKLHEDPESSGYFVLLFLMFDENQSWYLDENIASKQNHSEQENSAEIKEDEEFQESNFMYSVNGFMYNNLQGLETCYGSQVTWYLMGMGNEADMHAITFSGHPILVRGHRTDVVHLFPATFESAQMTAKHRGSWPIKSEVDDHDQKGMEAKFLVKDCGNHSPSQFSTSNGITRKYFLAAEEILWNYAPSGINKMNDVPLLNDSESLTFFERGEDRIGGTYRKAVYRGYSSSDLTEPLDHPSHLGLLGPTIRAEVGDTLEVYFFNKASKTFSFQLKAFVCSDCVISDPDEAVAPLQNRTYTFYISEDLGPSPKDPQCIAWRYFSGVEHMNDSYAGLNGVLLTCRPGSLNPDGTQKNVDKEFSLMFAVMDENSSPYIDENVVAYTSDPTSVIKTDEDFTESNLMHSINGLMYGNLIGLEMCINEKISWNVLSFGKEVDMHVAHFRGNTFLVDGLNRDTVDVMQGSHKTISMKPDSLGKWTLECRTNDHIRGGMQTHYKVKSCDQYEDSPAPSSDSKVRKYYIAAIEEEWDYSPSDFHIITGENLTENEDSRLFVTRDETHIGSKYKKALFREFTDSMFTQRKPRSPGEEHLGLLGPLIKADVGDIIEIVFQNKASREYNIRPHGLPENSDDIRGVEPGGTVTYNWRVPPRSGPTPGSFNCTAWAYYSSVDSIKDINTGLVGPLVVCSPGILTDTGSRTDVDKEFTILLTVFDENESWYLDYNIQNYCFEPENVNSNDPDFKESNLKHCVNGRLYGSLNGLEGNVGDNVAWYLMGLGNEVDIHTAHFHGLTFLERDDPLAGPRGHKADVTDLFPGIFRTVEMTFDTPGSWLFHCHVDDHLKGGMMALVTVKDRNTTAELH